MFNLTYHILNNLGSQSQFIFDINRRWLLSPMKRWFNELQAGSTSTLTRASLVKKLFSPPIQLQCTPYISPYYPAIQAAYLKVVQPWKNKSTLINVSRHSESLTTAYLRFPRWMTSPARIDRIQQFGPLFFSLSNRILFMLEISDDLRCGDERNDLRLSIST